LTTSTTKLNGKTYLVPSYNLEGYEKFLLPKLEFKGMQHVYYNPDDINQVYKDLKLDPENLECNLHYDPTQEKNQITEITRKTSKEDPRDKEEAKKEEESEEKEVAA
jgi:hypothetical protein